MEVFRSKNNAEEKVVLPSQKITKKTKNFQKKIRGSQEQFSYQKTVLLLKKGLSIQKVAGFRGIKEGTVWEHAVKGIASNNLSIYQVLTKERVLVILFHIHNGVDSLKMIKERIPNKEITYNEIACVLAHYKRKMWKTHFVAKEEKSLNRSFALYKQNSAFWSQNT